MGGGGDTLITFVDFDAKPCRAENSGRVRQKTRLLRALQMLSPAYRQKRKMDLRVNQSFTAFHKRFSEEWLKLLGVSEKPNLRPVLDVLVIGSDEVFNCAQFAADTEYGAELFGKGNRAKKLISYAASFGYTTMEKLAQMHREKEIGALLRQFDALSVRDENSRRIAEALGIPKRSVYRHIDPVLLYDFADELPASIPMKNYVIVYAYCGRLSKAEENAAREFAHKRGKQLISLGFLQPCCDTLVTADPFEVLAYFRGADAVITDTFHGAVMSIKYQKPFACFVRDSNAEKLGGLLAEFDLSNRAVKDPADIESVFCQPIDRVECERKLSEKRAEAMAYLRAQIGEKPESN